jgi:hypothetical protein
VPVLVVDLTDAEAELVLATFDSLSAMAEADPVLLDQLLKDVHTTSEAVAQMLLDLAKDAGCEFGQDGEVTEDDVPEPPDEAITKPGDLIVLGDHRLLCGDSSKPEDVDRLLDGKPIHLVNTDPPYNVKVEPRSNNAIAAGLSSFTSTHHQGLDLARHPSKSKPTQKKLRAKDRPLANDFVSDEAFDKLLLAWFGNMARVLEPGRVLHLGRIRELRKLPAGAEGVRPLLLAGDDMGQAASRYSRARTSWALMSGVNLPTPPF